MIYGSTPPRLILHKTFTFCAAHRYHQPAFSEEENQRAFGKDVQLHGHNYTLTISVTGDVDPATGFMVDLGHLKEIVREHVLEKLDHAQIDQDIPWFADKQPSTENLVVWIWNQIAPRLEGARLYRIRLQETPTIYTDYYGPTPE